MQVNAPISLSSRWWVLLGATAGILLVARWYLCYRQPHFNFGDEYAYLEIAQNLIEHRAYRLDRELIPPEQWPNGTPPGKGAWVVFAIRQAPGLPFSLALAGHLIPLTELTAKLINATIGWLTILMYAGAALVLTHSGPAVLAVMLTTGCHPSFLFLNTTNYPQTFHAFWLCALALLYVSKPQAPPKWGALEGATLGVGALYVPPNLFILPALALARFILPVSRWLRYSLALGAGFLLPLLPWIIRNAIVERAFIPFCTSGGEAMYLGFHYRATANPCVQEGENITTGFKSPPKLHDISAAKSASERQTLYYTAAAEWIRKHPSKALILWLRKFFNFFRWDIGLMKTKVEGDATVRNWLMRATTIVVFALFLTGYWLAGSAQRRWFYFCFLTLIFMAAGHAMYIARYRYRLPLEPMLLFVSITSLMCRWQSRAQSTTPSASTSSPAAHL